MRTDRRPLLDHWLWEPPVFWPYLIAAAAVPIVLSCVFVPLYGLRGLWALAFLSLPLLFGVVYRMVGRRVDRMQKSVPPADGVTLPALIVRGLHQAPGVVAIRPESLGLYPIAGGCLNVRLVDIT
ncbi:MAG: hypothetical protein H6816_15405, partial [Phycisphaerales bacterium]|nr:hypothetical protein [Phycisphaerales bacterium]